MSKKQSSKTHKAEADKVVRNIKRQARRKFSSEEKIRLARNALRVIRSARLAPVKSKSCVSKTPS
jgi:hypothetical protein